MPAPSEDDQPATPISSPRCLLDLPNEAPLAIIIRVEFSSENLANMSLVNKQIKSLMKTYKRQLLNDIAVVQFPVAHELRVEAGDQSVRSILRRQNVTSGIKGLVSLMMKTDIQHPALSVHQDVETLLTASCHIYSALRMHQFDWRSESDSAAIMLHLGPVAVASMYYSSIILCACLLRKASQFRHRRWLAFLSHPGAPAALSEIHLKDGGFYFQELFSNDALWRDGEHTESKTEPEAQELKLLRPAEDSCGSFTNLIAHVSSLGHSACADINVSSSNGGLEDKEEDVLKADGVLPNLTPAQVLRRAEAHLKRRLTKPNFLVQILRTTRMKWRSSFPSSFLPGGNFCRRSYCGIYGFLGLCQPRWDFTADHGSCFVRFRQIKRFISASNCCSVPGR